jgi:hypothetical protein
MEIFSIQEEIKRVVPSCRFVELGSQSVKQRTYLADEKNNQNK